MRLLNQLFENNRKWVAQMNERDSLFFEKLSKQQNPEILWIGCSDSRVPATQIVDVLPGEMFVHRNVANLVVHSDLNCLSVIQFAVEVLKIKHIIVCGHYRCGGVLAALTGERLGLIENWIGHIVDVKDIHREYLESLSEQKRKAALCELNVVEQVVNVCSTSIVRDRWAGGAPLSVHGWIYDITDGLLKDLKICVTNLGELQEIYRSSINGIYHP